MDRGVRSRVLRKMFLYVIFVVVVLGVVFGYVLTKSQNDQYGQPVYLNSGGSKSALIVYFPGLSSVQKDLTISFANGLVENNWSVDIYFANEDAPNPGEYDLLVLGTPCYGAQPSPSIMRYLERVESLKGIDTVVIASAAGNTGIKILSEEVNIMDGNVVLELEILTLDPEKKLADPEKTVFEAAKNLSEKY